MVRFSSKSCDVKTQIISPQPSGKSHPHRVVAVEAKQDKRFRFAETVVLDTGNHGRELRAKDRIQKDQHRKWLIGATIFLGVVTISLLFFTVGQMMTQR